MRPTGSELGLSELLPTGTVTLLLADVEGSTRLWETQPESMGAALALLNQTVDEITAAHHGVRPLEQGEGDSFVAAFARASDAVSCALALQHASLGPIRLRIGIHSGEIQLRDENNYAGTTINRTARLRELAHGGQTVLSGATELLVIDRLPDGVWLTELGSYPLRDLPRPIRVLQLCHPELCNDFPPLRVHNIAGSHNLPVPLTSFVGRQAEMAEVRQIIMGNRLITLTGSGGAGKTRLAVQVIPQVAAEFDDGIWWVDLAPITNPVVAPLTVARNLGLPDQPGRSSMDTLRRFLGEKKILLVLDNCEHLLDVCGTMVVELLTAGSHLTILTTSREPLGVPGELTWRVPSLPLADDAIELFTDRARRARPEFVVSEDNASLVAEICTRLDGMPLAIELAAARIRALSLRQIVDSLQDRFRLLTGGARTAMRRQQTLRASVDWSHALLTEPERVLFRRLAVFVGGFDLDAAQAVGASSDVESYQLLDQLSLLVDKSLVIADETADGMRYRLLETVRQYALEKLDESGEANEVRSRHRDYYTHTAAELDSQGHSASGPLMSWAHAETDNLRAAFVWSRENGDLELALRLINSLRPLWVRSGRVLEALAGLEAILASPDRSRLPPAVWAGAVSQRTILGAWAGVQSDPNLAKEALAIARELGDRELIVRALIACGMFAAYRAEDAHSYFAEAIDLVRASGDQWSLCQLFSYEATASVMAGEPLATRAAAEEGRDIADALGDGFFSRNNRAWLGIALMMQGLLAQGSEVSHALADEAEADGDLTMMVFGHVSQGITLAYRGQAAAAHTAAQRGLTAVEAMGGVLEDAVHGLFAHAALADGDAVAAWRSAETAWQHTNPVREVFTRSITPMAEAALAGGDLVTARRWADQNVAVLTGWHQMNALVVRAFVAIAEGKPDQAQRDAHAALAIATRIQAYLRADTALECLARLAADADDHFYATRLLGAANAMRERMGHRRRPMYQAGYDETLASVRKALGPNGFDAAWAAGAALSTEEAIAYAQRGWGERKRPRSGWGSLTPMENDVVRLVREGLANKEIGERLFISPRTVQTHLTHVFAKLGLTSRIQLIQEPGRHT